MSEASQEILLLCTVAGRTLGLRLSQVEETLRPLPIVPVAGAPAAIPGFSVIRDRPVPVVDMALLLGLAWTPPQRLVTIKIGERRAALAVTSVDGVRRLPGAQLQALPALFRDATDERVAGIVALDSELWWVLRESRLVPEFAWENLPDEVPA
ncbi:chemotaxis protein CheW [Tahibacter amnicola]|uniref:Chemotaxis protein CheW n=1 Tax=Tahibacter amnicola TaxID=2976241 RepID=A0ABY6BE87_9GAMM|nr:chemotaxis protein CheW [Tahibacter amnicola]UXI66655.1 chemotaxis protein CheW [Tahibacter amnicola]